jgi:endonuclease YncB( thermonuclease family)
MRIARERAFLCRELETKGCHRPPTRVALVGLRTPEEKDSGSQKQEMEKQARSQKRVLTPGSLLRISGGRRYVAEMAKADPISIGSALVS